MEQIDQLQAKLEKLTAQKIEAVKGQNFILAAELRDQEKIIQAEILVVQANQDKLD